VHVLPTEGAVKGETLRLIVRWSFVALTWVGLALAWPR
jgi:hypothetical protein